MRREHAPELRQGCYPQTGIKNPPHDFSKNVDNFSVRFIYPDQYDSILAWSYTHGVPQPVQTSGMPLYEITTGNGWRMYIRDSGILEMVLSLTSAGVDGLHLWMRGEDYDTAMRLANSRWQEKQQAIQDRRAAGPASPKNDLDNIISLDDI